MRKWVTFGVLAGLLLFSATSVRAQDGWGVSAGIPVNYKFSKDETTGQAPDAKSPSGLRVILQTPVRLGVGFARYTSGFADTALPWVGRTIDYSFLELQFNLPVDPVVFAVGFGLGSAEFTPVRANFGPIYQDFKPSSAQEWFLVGGYRLTDQLSIEASLHAMVIRAELDTSGTPGGGDIGATMTTVGAGWRF